MSPRLEGLKKAIRDLTSQLGADKIKGFVVDLRNNPQTSRFFPAYARHFVLRAVMTRLGQG